MILAVLEHIELMVASLFRQELLVGALFDDDTLIEEDDVVAVLDGTQAVGR